VRERGSTVSNVDVCGCGYVVRGEEDVELLEDADRHVRIAHPELIGTLSPLELAQPPAQDEAA
jgi:hypothetical protein